MSKEASVLKTSKFDIPCSIFMIDFLASRLLYELLEPRDPQFFSSR